MIKAMGVAILGGALLAAGCGDKGAGKGAEKDKGKTSAPAAPGTSGGGDFKVTTKVQVNAEIEAQINGIAANCEVNESSVYVTNCKGNESSKFNDFVREKKPKDLWNSLTEIASGTDTKLAVTAIIALADSMSSVDEALKKDNATEAAYQRVMTLLAKAEPYPAVRLSVPATYIATLRGEHAALVKLVDGHKSANVRVNAYKNMMTFGRMKVFEAEKAAAEKGPAEVTVAALDAPRSMYKNTAEEKAVYCPWAKGYLSNSNHNIVVAAAYTMNHCQGEYIDAMLDEMEKRHKAGEIKDRTLLFPVREMCMSIMSGVVPVQGVVQQCERNFAFLQKIADDEAVPSVARGSALWNIYYQRRDQKSLDLMRKYENHKDPEVQKQAKDAIKSLTTTYKLK